jgi:L-idonate 5-dehydrogenase
LMGEGLISIQPLITASLPFASAVEAFELASDRSKSMKVQLIF